MIRPHCTLSLLTAACLYGLLAVSCSPTVDYGYAPQTLRALNELDEAMLRGGEYDAGRQRRIASLRRNLAAARSDEERVRALLDLQQVFVTYELDSAARFVDSLYAFARSRESHNFERIAALAETDVLMGRGLTDQAETLFRQIDTAGMTTLEYRNWYARYNAIVWRRQAEATDPGEHRAWLDSLRRIRHIRIGVESLPAFTRIRERALELADNGRYDEAYAELEPLRHKELAPWNTAVLYYDMGQIAEQAGQEERAVEYYTRSAIADLQAGTRSYFSLYNLALRLFERNDLERASRYMQRTLDDALACKSGARIPLTSSAATAINRAVVNDLAAITGQKPVVCKAKKSVANFKLREGMPIGVKVTLRGDRMYEFLDRLFNVALPRVRDFRGINPNSFDGRGNYNMGIREQLIFPEIDYDKVDKVRGMDICFVTTANTDEEAREFLTLMGAPFTK